MRTITVGDAMLSRLKRNNFFVRTEIDGDNRIYRLFAAYLKSV